MVETSVPSQRGQYVCGREDTPPYSRSTKPHLPGFIANLLRTGDRRPPVGRPTPLRARYTTLLRQPCTTPNTTWPQVIQTRHPLVRRRGNAAWTRVTPFRPHCAFSAPQCVAWHPPLQLNLMSAFRTLTRRAGREHPAADSCGRVMLKEGGHRVVCVMRYAHTSTVVTMSGGIPL